MNAVRSSVTRAYAQRARTQLPGPAVRSVRALLMVWGRLTIGLRMEPSFIVVGAQRAGTTTLFRLLSDHPDLVRPTLCKGTSYFDDEFTRGPRWYRAHFPLRLSGLIRTRRLGRAQTFECSGYYMFHPHAAQRIAATLPNVKLIAVVRDPVDRAYSAHQHELRRGFERLDFRMAVALEPERTAFETHRLEREPAHRSFEHRHHAYLARSSYADQLERLVAAVGAERLLVVDADAFFADPVEEFVRVQSWLGLRIWRPDQVPVANAEARVPLSQADRNALLDHFVEADAELSRFLGHPPSWRQTEQPVAASAS